jgi:hypothetical protein
MAEETRQSVPAGVKRLDRPAWARAVAQQVDPDASYAGAWLGEQREKRSGGRPTGAKRAGGGAKRGPAASPKRRTRKGKKPHSGSSAFFHEVERLVAEGVRRGFSVKDAKERARNLWVTKRQIRYHAAGHDDATALRMARAAWTRNAKDAAKPVQGKRRRSKGRGVKRSAPVVPSGRFHLTGYLRVARATQVRKTKKAARKATRS